MGNHKKTIKDIEVKDKKVILRVDFNVPVENGKILDDERIQATLPTLYNLLSRKAKIILISHLGQPKDHDPEFSLKPIAAHLAILLERGDIPVLLLENADTKKQIDSMKAGDIVMLENIRFYAGEKNNDDAFAKQLASLGDIFVNDAFAVCHRAQASVVGIPEYLPSVAGNLLEEEIKFLTFFMQHPAKPIVAIIGGKKVSTKVAVLDTYLEKADTILVGGGAANTFLKAWGDPIGTSFVEESMIATCKELIWKAARCHTALLVPTDAVVTTGLDKKSKVDVVATKVVPDNMSIVDIGPDTIERFAGVIKSAGTIIWSGPMGVTEDPRFSDGTDSILEAIASTDANCVVGGGDTLAAIRGKKGVNSISHISTGGGATLEFIEKGTLPGIEALNDK